MTELVYPRTIRGFSLIELMLAITVLTIGLLAVSQLFFIAASSSSLSGAKGSAAIAAQDMLESLADRYYRNPAVEDLALGNHGPRQLEVTNPADGTIVNRYTISWVVNSVSDPRPGKAVDAKRVSVTITPIKAGGAENNRPPFNKTLSVATLFSPEMR
jgi:prepilin-type N-terminal cleavage/methylation domain-containing protein